MPQTSVPSLSAAHMLRQHPYIPARAVPRMDGDDLLGMCSMLKNNTPVVKLVRVECKDSYTGNWSKLSKQNSRKEFKALVPPHFQKLAWQR